jgi:hypothetical protein
VRNPAFVRLLDEIRAIHDSKSHDYADADPLSNLRMCESFGVPAFHGVMVRLSDKWSRLVQLVGGKTPKHESLRDTLIDQAVYSLLAVILLDEQAPSLATGGLAIQAGDDVPPMLPAGPMGFVIPDSRKLRP